MKDGVKENTLATRNRSSTCNYDIIMFIIIIADRRWVDKIKPQSWNYGNALYDWLGGKIKEKAGDQDATFLQVA